MIAKNNVRLAMRQADYKRDGSGLPCLSFPRNVGIQKAQITTMVNPVQTFPDWIPAFAGMTGFGLSESDKNSGNGYKRPDDRRH